MKKILLLSITSLAMLMADFTLEGDTLTPVSDTTTPVTDPTPPPTTSDPVSTPGILPNSLDLIWDDLYGPNIGYTSQTNSGYPQFHGGVARDFPNMDVASVNAWYEIEEQGNGSSCSPSINQATNTVVEAGYLRAWVLYADGEWRQYENTIDHEGMNMPSAGDPFAGDNFRGCGTIYNPIRLANPLDTREGLSANGFGIYKPEHYWVWHGWGHTIHALVKPHKAVFVQLYLRLAVQNPNLPDDRHLANYVAHIGSDYKNSSYITLGDVGISRFKKITNDWQPFNLITGGITKAELEANPPPFVSVP